MRSFGHTRFQSNSLRNDTFNDARHEPPKVRHEIDVLAFLTATHSEVGEEPQARADGQDELPEAPRARLAPSRHPVNAHQNAERSEASRGRPDGKVRLAPIAPGIERIAQRAAEQDRQPGQAATQARNEEGREEQASRQVGHEMRSIAVQGERGDRSPPLAGKDGPGVGDTAFLPRRTGLELDDEEASQHPGGDKERQFWKRSRRHQLRLGKAPLLFLLGVEDCQFPHDILDRCFLDEQQPFVCFALDPIRQPHRGNDQSTLARLGEPCKTAHLHTREIGVERFRHAAKIAAPA